MKKACFTLGLLLCFAACADDPSGAEGNSESSERPEIVESAENNETEAANEPTALNPPPVDPGTAQASPEDERLAQGLEYLNVMMRTAQNAEQEGLSSCEQAYVTSRAVAEAAVANPPPDVELPSLDDFPERELFLDECGKLPEDQQACVAPAYAMAHPECRELLRSEAFLAFRDAVRPQSARNPQGSAE